MARNAALLVSSRASAPVMPPSAGDDDAGPQRLAGVGDLLAQGVGPADVARAQGDGVGGVGADRRDADRRQHGEADQRAATGDRVDGAGSDGGRRGRDVGPARRGRPSPNLRGRARRATDHRSGIGSHGDPRPDEHGADLSRERRPDPQRAGTGCGQDHDREHAPTITPRTIPGHDRPAGVDDATVGALGKLSEALEAVEHARGFLVRVPPPLRHGRPDARRRHRRAARRRAHRARRRAGGRPAGPQRHRRPLDVPARRGVRRRLLRTVQGPRASGPASSWSAVAGTSSRPR